MHKNLNFLNNVIPMKTEKISIVSFESNKTTACNQLIKKQHKNDVMIYNQVAIKNKSNGGALMPSMLHYSFDSIKIKIFQML